MIIVTHFDSYRQCGEQCKTTGPDYEHLGSYNQIQLWVTTLPFPPMVIHHPTGGPGVFSANVEITNAVYR